MPGISMFYGWWEYWNLRHKVTFDGINKLILINEGETNIDVKVDMYSDWKEWARTEDNLKYLPAFNTVGGESIVTGQKLDVTYFLINGWKIKPYQGTYDLNLIGNIFDVDGGSIKVPADVNRFNPNNITINTNTSVIVRQIDGTSGTNTTPGDLSDEGYASLYNIEGKVVSIFSGATPVSASLVSNQFTTLTEIQNMVSEIWKLHGLDISNPLTVTRTSRTFDDIVQSIETVHSGSSQETIITRL